MSSKTDPLCGAATNTSSTIDPPTWVNEPPTSTLNSPTGTIACTTPLSSGLVNEVCMSPVESTRTIPVNGVWSI